MLTSDTTKREIQNRARESYFSTICADCRVEGDWQAGDVIRRTNTITKRTQGDWLRGKDSVHPFDFVVPMTCGHCGNKQEYEEPAIEETLQSSTSG